MVYIKRKERESTPAMLRRFTRRVQQSGVLIRARKVRFYVKRPSKRSRRERALKRLELLRERERLMKLGKLEAPERPFRS